jgi:hypothetical protein
VLGLDYSEAYVNYASRHVGGGGQFLVGDGALLSSSDGVFDRSLS